MLKNIFGKTLFERKMVILEWFAATLVVLFGTAMIFPGIRDSFGTVMGTMPDSMKGWMGTTDSWSTYNGYAGQELFHQMVILPSIAMILFGANFLAGEEGSTLLLTTLSKPLKRYNLYLQKYFALVVTLFAIMAGYFLGIILGGIALGESINYQAMLQSTLVATLLALVLGTLSFCLGAATGKKSIAGVVVGFYAFLSYFIASLSTAGDIVDKISYATVFRYFVPHDIMAGNFDVNNVFILLAIIIVPHFIALPIFAKRDLLTR
ncbi:MAG: ABC transporter permease subunit [Bifidobacteriaceae bacterium]|jgi:ABC-type transport system involved in multi-copper enzyme maturation permease subunit|nr:ABC transporter permease subunit [Bifidobacteriaceae bacterium]